MFLTYTYTPRIFNKGLFYQGLLCRLASCYCNKMIEDQTTRQGAGHAWGKNCSKRKSINHQLCIGAGRSINDHSSCRFVYTQKFSLPTLCSTLKTRLFSKKESLLIAFQIINSFGNMGHSTYLITRCSRGIY